MKKIVMIFVCFLLCSCGSKNKLVTNDKELQKILDDNNYIIIDVRSNEEYNSGHIVDSINIPVNLIDENINIDQNKTILVYCLSGGRSKIAYDTLISLGYDVYDLGAYDKIDLPKE